MSSPAVKYAVLLLKVPDSFALKFPGSLGLRADDTIGLLICTLISENQGLEKSGSASNLRKISGPANMDFFSRSPPRKKARFIP